MRWTIWAIASAASSARFFFASRTLMSTRSARAAETPPSVTASVETRPRSWPGGMPTFAAASWIVASDLAILSTAVWFVR